MRSNLSAVRGITEGPEAQRRKAHNNTSIHPTTAGRPQVGPTSSSGRTDYSKGPKFNLGAVRDIANVQKQRRIASFLQKAHQHFGITPAAASPPKRKPQAKRPPAKPSPAKRAQKAGTVPLNSLADLSIRLNFK